MARRRNKKRNKNKYKQKPEIKKMSTISTAKELGITGRFRIIKSVLGNKLLVQNRADEYVPPTQEQLDYLVKEKRISADTKTGTV